MDNRPYLSERDKRLCIRQQRIMYQHYHMLYKITEGITDITDQYVYPHFLYIHVMQNDTPHGLKNPSSSKKEYY